MASIYIEQYASIFEDAKGNEAQLPSRPLGTEPVTKVTIGASSARTSADFDESAKFLIITADADCQFELGDSSITADTNSRPLWSGTYREVEIGSATRIAVIEKQ